MQRELLGPEEMLGTKKTKEGRQIINLLLLEQLLLSARHCICLSASVLSADRGGILGVFRLVIKAGEGLSAAETLVSWCCHRIFISQNFF